MKKIMVTLFFAVSMLLLMQCGSGNAESNENDLPPGIPVEISSINRQSFANYLQLTGTVQARNHIKVVVEEGGTLKRVLVEKGRYAKAGQTLAILENKVLEATYKQAKAVLEQAKLDHRSKEVLYSKKAISENEYLNAQYAIESARAAYDLALARYDKLTIKAPIAGLVNDRYQDLGAFVNPMEPIFELIDNAVMKIQSGVAERFLSNVVVGTPVEIRFDAYPEWVIDGKVGFRSNSIDPQNRTFEIEVQVPNADRKLAPQMVANMRIKHQQFKDRIVVPLDALIESENGWYVFLKDDNIARRVAIKQVAIYDNNVLVEGLQPQQNLIVVGHRELTDGDTVYVASAHTAVN